MVDWSRQRVMPRSQAGRMIVFQSLLWWIGRVNIGVPPIRPGRDKFQSLLWWIGRVNSIRSGSNSSARPPGDRFQSLLWWIGRVNWSAPPTTWPPDSRFNPCCGGLVASTWTGRIARPARPAVSILVVVDWSRQPANLSRRRDRPCRVFQSLLWWIGRVNRTARERVLHDTDVSILVVVDWSRQPVAA